MAYYAVPFEDERADTPRLPEMNVGPVANG